MIRQGYLPCGSFLETSVLGGMLQGSGVQGGKASYIALHISIGGVFENPLVAKTEQESKEIHFKQLTPPKNQDNAIKKACSVIFHNAMKCDKHTLVHRSEALSRCLTSLLDLPNKCLETLVAK